MNRRQPAMMIVQSTLALLVAASVPGCVLPDGVPAAFWPLVPKCEQASSGPRVVDGCAVGVPSGLLVYNRTAWHPLCMAECPESPAAILAPQSGGPTIPGVPPGVSDRPKEPAAQQKTPQQTPLSQPPGVLEGMLPLESPEALEEIPPMEVPQLPLPPAPPSPAPPALPSVDPSPPEKTGLPTEKNGPPTKKTGLPPEPGGLPTEKTGLPTDSAGSTGDRLPSEAVGEGAALLPERMAPLRRLILPGLPPDGSTAFLRPEPQAAVESASWDPTD